MPAPKTIFCSGGAEVTRHSHGEFSISTTYTTQEKRAIGVVKVTSHSTVMFNKQSAHDILVALLEFFPQMRAEIRKKVRNEIKRRADRRKALLSENDRP